MVHSSTHVAHCRHGEKSQTEPYFVFTFQFSPHSGHAQPLTERTHNRFHTSHSLIWPQVMHAGYKGIFREHLFSSFLNVIRGFTCLILYVFIVSELRLLLDAHFNGKGDFCWDLTTFINKPTVNTAVCYRANRHLWCATLATIFSRFLLHCYVGNQSVISYVNHEMNTVCGSHSN